MFSDFSPIEVSQGQTSNLNFNVIHFKDSMYIQEHTKSFPGLQTSAWNPAKTEKWKFMHKCVHRCMCLCVCIRACVFIAIFFLIAFLLLAHSCYKRGKLRGKGMHPTSLVHLYSSVTALWCANINTGYVSTQYLSTTSLANSPPSPGTVTL